MSYAQAMKHYHNHSKDRYFQQCGCGYSLDEWAYCVIDSETKDVLSENCKTKAQATSVYLALSRQFPTRNLGIADIYKGQPIIYN